eukprot:scaffold21192_cov18-Tisochrysis_lutea.AAC.2
MTNNDDDNIFGPGAVFDAMPFSPGQSSCPVVASSRLAYMLLSHLSHEPSVIVSSHLAASP